MASFFSLYVISLSKSDIRSSLLGSNAVNVLTSIFIITSYYNNNKWWHLGIWTLLLLWFLYKLRKNYIAR